MKAARHFDSSSAVASEHKLFPFPNDLTLLPVVAVNSSHSYANFCPMTSKKKASDVACRLRLSPAAPPPPQLATGALVVRPPTLKSYSRGNLSKAKLSRDNLGFRAALPAIPSARGTYRCIAHFADSFSPGSKSACDSSQLKRIESRF